MRKPIASTNDFWRPSEGGGSDGSGGGGGGVRQASRTEGGQGGRWTGY